ncbi:hypothetical protein D3C86_2096220 [compost metagenome]
MSLLGMPSTTRRITSRSRSVRSVRRERSASRSRMRARCWSETVSACTMRSTSALSENGFSQKSKAPRLTVSTAVGTSAWPVRKITGMAAS